MKERERPPIGRYLLLVLTYVEHVRRWPCLALAALLASCGAAEAPASARARRPPVAAVAQEEPRACRIEAMRAEGLFVSTGQREPLVVSVSDGVLSFVPTRDARRLGVEVESPLEFRAEARTDEQRLTTARAGEAAAGIFHMVAGLDVAGLAHRERGLHAHVRLGRSSLAARGVELVVGPLEIVCESLGALAEPEPRRLSSYLRSVPGGELRVAASAPLVLVSSAGEGELEVQARLEGGVVPAWIVAREGERVRVVIAFSDGARVEGWTASSTIREPTAIEAELVESAVRESASSPIHYGVLGAAENPASAQGENEYVGLASLRPSSAVFADPGEARWATSMEQPIEVRARWERGAPYARLLEVPGFWAPPGRAWVRRSDLALVEP